MPKVIMLSQSEPRVAELNFFDEVFAQVFSTSHKPKTHNFTKQMVSVNYEVEEIDGRRTQMTGYGKAINCGDYILLTKEGIRYRVEAINYYANPRNLWTALLLKCSA